MVDMVEKKESKSEKPYRVGVVGLGYWGRNHCRTVNNMKGVVLSAVQDELKIVAENIANEYSIHGHTVIQAKSRQEMADKCHAVIIATPANTHDDLTWFFLRQGVHVLCEKPTSPYQDVEKQFINFAHQKNLVYLPGLTFLFHPAIWHIKQRFFNAKELGEFKHAMAVRTNLGPVRKDVGAMQDLGVHDLSILCYMLDDCDAIKHQITNFSSRGTTNPSGTSQMNLAFTKGLRTIGMASIYASWEEPGKKRNLRFVFEKGVVEFDDTKMQPITIHTKGASTQIDVSREREPLAEMLKFFVDCMDECGKKNNKMLNPTLCEYKMIQGVNKSVVALLE